MLVDLQGIGKDIDNRYPGIAVIQRQVFLSYPGLPADEV